MHCSSEKCGRETYMEELETRRRANDKKKASIVLFLIGVGFLFGVVINLLLFFLAIIFFGIAAYVWKSGTTWSIGAEGEESVIRALQNLDSSFKVVNDIVLPGDNQNIDHVVVGPAGIFVIETKNYNGIIRCYGDEWSRKKIGRRGTVYDGGIGNPSKQAKRNAIVLKNWLQSQNVLVTYIDAIVVFTNEDVELRVSKPTVKVVHVDDLLPVFNPKPNYSMSVDKINSIAESLYKLK